jgi:transposase
VLNWCRKYGKLHYPEAGTSERQMKDPQKQRIKELEKQLEDAKLKLLAYEKLISIAEKAEGISILKKDAAKQLTSLPKPTQEK